MMSDSFHAKKMTIWIVSAAFFMETLDITILSTAIPSMARTFSVNPIELKLALTSYLLGLALFIPISGWLSDRLGTKTVFMSALSLFTLTSIGCGMSQSLGGLIFFRIMQGMGGAFMMPVGRLILLRTFQRSELVHATNLMTIPGLLGPLLGPVVGGFITTYFSWPWIFYVNVPIGLIGISAAFHYMQNYTSEGRRPFDVLGFILFALSLSGLFFVIETAHSAFVSLQLILQVSIFTVIGSLLFALHYRKAKDPVLDLNLFTMRTFKVAALGNLWSRMGISSISFLLPLFFQIGYGLSPFHSGLLICAWAAGMMTMKPFSKAILRKLGFRKMLSTTGLLIGLSLASFFFITSIHIAWILGLIYFNGLIASLQFLGMNLLYYSKLENHQMSHATSIASTIQQLSSAFGITVTALILQFFVGWSCHVQSGDPLPFRHSFLITGGIICFSALLFRRLKKNDGKDMIQ